MASNTNTLAENPYVQELFSTLKENNKDTAGLTALLGYVKQMEDFVKSAEGKIVDMKTQIADMQEIQKHPVKAALTNTAESLQTKVTSIKDQLDKIRNSIVQACKNTLTAVKNTGITALDKMAGFLGIKKACEQIQKDCTQAMARCDKSINNIEQFSKEYHQTGLHLKNMFRLAIGKEALETPKENGQVAKTMCAPYKAQKKCFNNICKTANKAVEKLDALWINADDIRKERQAAKQAKQAVQERKDPAAERIAMYEAKAKQINAASAEKAAEKTSNVIEFKPKTNEAVMA